MKLTYAHMIEAFLFLECIVDVGGDKRVHQVVVVAIAVCAVDGFALAFWSWPCLGHKLVEEPDCRTDEGRFGVGHVAIEELGEVVEQAVKGGAVYEDLQDCIRKAHVSRVDETARTDFHEGLGGWAGCEEGQQLGFFARGDDGGGCGDGEADDGRGGEGIGF